MSDTSSNQDKEQPQQCPLPQGGQQIPKGRSDNLQKELKQQQQAADANQIANVNNIEIQQLSSYLSQRSRSRSRSRRSRSRSISISSSLSRSISREYSILQSLNQQSLSYVSSKFRDDNSSISSQVRRWRGRRRRRRRSRSDSQDDQIYGYFKNNNQQNQDNFYRCQFSFHQNSKGQLANCYINASFISSKNLYLLMKNNQDNLPFLQKMMLNRINFDACQRKNNNPQRYRSRQRYRRRKSRKIHNIQQIPKQQSMFEGICGISVLNKFNLSNLYSLCMGNSQLDRDDIKQLIKQNQTYCQEGYQLTVRKWPNLRKLYLRNCKIQKLSMSQLSQNYWENIQQVNLQNNQLFNEGIKYLIRCYWPKLIYLNLSNCSIGESGAITLTKSNWPQLKRLKLDCNLINLNGIKNLLDKNFWYQMKEYSNLKRFQRGRRIDQQNQILNNTIILNLSKTNWKKILSNPYRPGQIGRRQRRQSQQSQTDSLSSLSPDQQQQQQQNAFVQNPNQVNVNDYQLGINRRRIQPIQRQRKISIGQFQLNFYHNFIIENEKILIMIGLLNSLIQDKNILIQFVIQFKFVFFLLLFLFILQGSKSIISKTIRSQKFYT